MHRIIWYAKADRQVNERRLFYEKIYCRIRSDEDSRIGNDRCGIIRQANDAASVTAVALMLALIVIVNIIKRLIKR